MRYILLAATILTPFAANAQSLQSGSIGGMPYYLLPASGGCSAATPCSVITYLGVQSESAGAIANDVQSYFAGNVGPHTIVIAPQENGAQDSANNWGGYNTATTPEGNQMVAVVQGVEAQMGNAVNPAASVVTGGSLGGTGTQAALIAYGPKGQVQPGVFSAGVSFDAADYNAANDPSQIAALCGVPLMAVHGTADTNQNVSYDQNLATAINSNPACSNSFTFVPIAGHGHGTWSDPSGGGYQSGTGPGTPLATIAADLGRAPSTGTLPQSTPAAALSTPAAALSTQGAATLATGQALSATLTPGKGSVTDCNGTVWTVSASGNVMQGSTVVPGGGDTSALQLVGCTVYGQDNGDDPSRVNSGGWFTLNTGGWVVSAAPTASATANQSTGTKVANVPAIPAPTVCGNGVPSGAFKVVGGQIIGPDGKPFIARGLDLHADNLAAAAAQLPTQFTGVNLVRVASGDYESLPDPASMADAVTSLTSRGTVVEFSDYSNSLGTGSGGGQGNIFTGGQLAAENNWFAAMASYYKNNPYVWFGTDNEPSLIYPSNSNAVATGPQSLSAWQKTNYDAIRGTGNTSPILLEPGGDAVGNYRGGAGIPMMQFQDPGVVATMKNVVWDPHIYGYMNNYAMDGATNDALVAGVIAAVQAVPSADGVVPAIIGEYGPEGDNGMQLVAAVINAGANGKAGSGAWVWDQDGVVGGPTNDPADAQFGLLVGGQMTTYGQMVQLYINTSVQPCSTAEANTNANATLTAITAQVTGTPTATDAAPAAASASPITETLLDTTTTVDTDGETAIAQANAIITAAQAQLKANQ
jgi:hypothetical protein